MDSALTETMAKHPLLWYNILLGAQRASYRF
jgi:hypothetical protein